MRVGKRQAITLSLDQIDAKTVNNDNYSYSYFRITVTKMGEANQLIFVDSLLSPERNIFVEGNFSAGQYLILVEAYWSTQLANSFAIGTYSEDFVELEQLSCNEPFYRNSEYLAWRNFAQANKS